MCLTIAGTGDFHTITLRHHPLRMFVFLLINMAVGGNTPCVSWRGYCCSPDWYCTTPDEQNLWERTHIPPPCPPPPNGTCPPAPLPGSGQCQYWPLTGQCSFELPEAVTDMETGNTYCTFSHMLLASLAFCSN